MFEPRDAPYPEVKKSHTIARTGRPYTDFKPPAAAPVWAAIEGLGRYHVLLAAIELGVFDALRDAGPSTAPALAERLGVSAPHLASLLDGVIALDLLDKVRDTYELNDAAKRYLVSDGPACMADLIPVAPGPHDNWTRLADTVRHGRPSTPIEDDPEAFYVPLVEGTFTTMWRTATRADLKMRYSTTPAAADPRPRCRRRTVVDRDAHRVPAGHRRRQRPRRRARRRPAQDRRVRRGRPLRVPARRLLRDRRRSRPRTTSSCSATSAAPRAPTGRSA